MAKQTTPSASASPVAPPLAPANPTTKPNAVRHGPTSVLAWVAGHNPKQQGCNGWQGTQAYRTAGVGQTMAQLVAACGTGIRAHVNWDTRHGYRLGGSAIAVMAPAAAWATALKAAHGNATKASLTFAPKGYLPSTATPAAAKATKAA